MPQNKFKHKTVNTNSNKALMEHLRVARKRAGLTLRDVGAKLGVPHTLVGKVETLERRLDVIEFVRYCEILGIEPADAIKVV